jgi:amidase
VPAPVPNYLAGLPRGIRGVRIAVDRAFNTTGVDKDMVKVVDDAIAVLTDLGADIREARFPSPDQIVKDWLPLCAVETAVAHEATFPKHADQYGPALRGIIESGRALSGFDLTKILIARAAFRGEVEAFFQDVDLLVIPAQYAASPTTATMATLGEDPKALEMLLRFTSPFDVTGSPTITLPGGFTAKRLPVAFQLVSRPLEEDLLLRAGHAFQLATDWHKRRPLV